MSIWFKVNDMTSIPESCTCCNLYLRNCCPTLTHYHHTSDVVSKLYNLRRHEKCTLHNDEPELDYIPTCPRGYPDCVSDPAYVRRYHDPTMSDDTFEEMIAECQKSFEDDPEMKYYCYDDEDK